MSLGIHDNHVDSCKVIVLTDCAVRELLGLVRISAGSGVSAVLCTVSSHEAPLQMSLSTAARTIAVCNAVSIAVYRGSQRHSHTYRGFQLAGAMYAPNHVHKK